MGVRIETAWTKAGPALDRWLIRVIVAGIFVRLIIVVTTFGSSDTAYWWQYADLVSREGLSEAYELRPLLNHPPLATLFVTALLRISDAVPLTFATALRLPAVIADLFALRLLYMYWLPSGRRYGLTAAAIYAAAPVAILISSYHGNTDTIYTVALLAAAVMLQKNRGLAAGIAFAIAINIKLIPLVVGPALLIAAWQRKQAIRFLLASSAGLLGFLPLALDRPDLLLDNILSYVPNATQWGSAGLVSLFGGVEWLAWVAVANETHLRLILPAVVIAGLALAVRHGQRDPIRLAIWPVAVLLVLSPTVAPQYLVLMLPLLLAANLKYGAAWAVAASPYALALYVVYFKPDLRPLIVSEFVGPVDSWVVVLGLTALLMTAIIGWKVAMNASSDGTSEETPNRLHWPNALWR